MVTKAQHDDDDDLAMRANRTPKQDPSELTRLAVLEAKAAAREIVGALREVLETKIDGRGQAVDQRFAGMDKAIQLLQAMRDQGHVEVEAKISALRILHEEKFHSIDKQFAERDVRTETSASQVKIAVDAALQAAKEAVAEQNRSSAASISKSELATTKQIDGQGMLITNSTKSLDDKISDVKERLTRLEGVKSGVNEQQDRTGAFIIGVSIVLATVIAAITLALSTRSPVQPTTAYVPAPVVQVAPNGAK